MRDPKKYYAAAQIDYLEHFAQLWIGFNAWYRIRWPGGPDRVASLKVATHSRIKLHFDKTMNEVNDVDSHILRVLDQLSSFPVTGGETAHIDVSGDKLRVRASRSNSFIDFLEAAAVRNSFGAETRGLLFLNPDDPDGVFLKIYRKYGAHMATPAMIMEASNAQDIIDTHLAALKIQNYGRLIFHNLMPVEPSGALYSLDDIFGRGYLNRCKKLRGNTPGSFPKGGALRIAKGLQGEPLLARYLSAIYQFRSAYFHGDLDPTDPENQKLAKYAHQSLVDLMRPELG